MCDVWGLGAGYPDLTAQDGLYSAYLPAYSASPGYYGLRLSVTDNRGAAVVPRRTRTRGHSTGEIINMYTSILCKVELILLSVCIVYMCMWHTGHLCHGLSLMSLGGFWSIFPPPYIFASSDFKMFNKSLPVIWALWWLILYHRQKVCTELRGVRILLWFIGLQFLLCGWRGRLTCADL